MTGFKDKLKDALSDFVEFDENAPPSENAGQPASKQRPAPKAGGATSAASIDTSLSDPEMVATLEHAVARSTEPGYDQFRALYSAMESVPDERLRYDVTLKALQASHQLSPQAVLASIEDRIRLLEAERTKFEQALKSETDRSINGTNRELQTVGDAIAGKQKEIQELQARQAALVQTTKDAQADIDRSRASFAAAFASVHSSLDAERTRISTHLSGGK
jgi:uncharacterized protein YicC (UPF0701 family)